MAEILFQMEVPITPQWPHIELLRSSVLNLLATMFQDSEFCHSVGMITSELLENAVKYGDWSGDRTSFKLKVSGDETAVEVMVANPVQTGGKDLAELDRTLTFLAGHADPQEAYLERLRQVAEREDGDGTSRLGLTRIAYEGRCAISADVDEGILHVRARSRR